MLTAADSTAVTGLITAQQLNMLLAIQMAAASLMLSRHCHCAHYKSIVEVEVELH